MQTINFKQYFEYRDGELFWTQSTAKKIKVGDICNNKNITTGYKRVGLYGKRYSNHRIIWEMFNGAIPKGLNIDHINGKRDDNRIENLQLVTQTQNIQRRDGGKGYTKVGKLYQSARGFNNKVYYLGLFGTPCGAYMTSRMFHVRGLHE